MMAWCYEPVFEVEDEEEKHGKKERNQHENKHKV
jgi:hypothetical protein